MSEPCSQLEVALSYAKRGLPVFPCNEEKRPKVAGGFHSATTDEQQVKEWWTRWPDALIGLPTGSKTGVMVLDVDVRPFYDGNDALAELSAKHGPIPDTVEVLTPSGGRHIYFQYHDGLTNSAGQLGLGLDIRAEGGYVIAPDSIVPGGKRYEIEASSPETPARAPAWLLELLQKKPVNGSANGLDLSHGAPEGARNQYLASIAGTLAHAGLQRQQIRAMLLAENERACHPPLSVEEIDQTVMRSASRWILKAQGGLPESPEQSTALQWVQDAEWVASVRPPDWLVPGHLERGSMSVTIGGWGSGKSLIELDRALRIAHGMLWHGIRCTQAGVWVYIVGEAQRGFQRRVAAWHQHHGVEPNGRFIVIPQAVLIGDVQESVALEFALRDIQDRTGFPVLGVSIDTLARCFGLESEDKASDMAKWANACARHIVEPTGACVSILHHPGHGDKTRGRGSSALPGAADTEWLVARHGTQVVMSVNKSKDDEPPPPKAWRIFGVPMDNGTDRWVSPCVTEEDVGYIPPVLQIGGKQGQALTLLRQMYDEQQRNLDEAGGGIARVEKSAWRAECEATGLTNYRQQFNRMLDELTEKGAIECDGYFVFLKT